MNKRMVAIGLTGGFILGGIIALTFWLTQPAFAATCADTTHDGNIVGDELWCAGIHSVTTAITIDGTVTIEPGTQIEVTSNDSIFVNGSLVAQGTAEQPIIFTSGKAAPAPGDVGQLSFKTGSTGNVLEHVIIEYGGNGSGVPGLKDPSLYINTDDVTIRNSMIRYGRSYGMEIDNASPTISDTRFADNGASDILLTGGSSFPALSNLTAGEIEIIGATIDRNYTWGDGGVHNYLLSQDVEVADVASLTIAPSTTVRFLGAYRVSVDGTLKAQGTAEQPIIFTSGKAAPAPGDWGNISFSTSSRDGLLEHVIIEYGGNGSSVPGLQDPSVFIGSDDITISNSMIRYGRSYGMEIDNASPTISDTRFADNDASDILLTGGSSFPALSNITADEMTVSGATIDRDYTWGDGGVKNYLLTQDVDIAVGSSLTIEQGTDIRFTGAYRLNVEGSLRAQGTAGQQVTVTSNKDLPERGDWGYIYFAPGSTANLLEHVIVEYGGNGSRVPGLRDPSILIDSSDVQIRDSIIRYGRAVGLEVGSVSPDIDSTIFINNGNSNILLSSSTTFPQLTNLSSSDSPFNHIEIGSSNLEASTTWGGTGMDTYFLPGMLTVNMSATLTIKPRTTVKVDGGSLVVDGSLKARGTAAAPIRFTSTSDTPQSGDWGQITFQSSSISNTLLHTIVEYGGAGNVGGLNDPSVRVATDDLLLQDNIIRLSGGAGMAVENAQPTIQYNQFVDNAGRALLNLTPDTQVTARCNWWGSETGPTHPDNPDGTGQEVSDGVDFTPWLTPELPEGCERVEPPSPPEEEEVLVSVFASNPTATEGGAPGAFTITRTGSLTNSLVVTYTVGGTATAGMDYEALPGTATIRAGSDRIPVTVTAINDETVQVEERTIIVTIQQHESYTLAEPLSTSVAIIDDDEEPIATQRPVFLPLVAR